MNLVLVIRPRCYAKQPLHFFIIENNTKDIKGTYVKEMRIMFYDII